MINTPTFTTAAAFDVARVRADFPILKLTVAGKPLVYLDNAASSQMPQPVIDRLLRYQTTEHANIHRAVHYLSEAATSGTTDSINLVMHGWGRKNIKAGDEIILTVLEHHSNIVPWQMLALEKGASLRVVPINDAGELLLDEYQALFNERTRLVLSLIHI